MKTRSALDVKLLCLLMNFLVHTMSVTVPIQADPI